MSTLISSKRYAQAIFQIAREKNELEQWNDILQQIKKLMQNEQLLAVMENPKLHFEQKSKILNKLLDNKNTLALNFVYLLILKNRFRQVNQIAEQYEYLLDEFKGIRRATVTTSSELDDAGKNKLAGDLEKLVNNKLKVDFNVDSAIVGGFIARFDGTLLDGSVKHKLELLRNKLISVTK